MSDLKFLNIYRIFTLIGNEGLLIDSKKNEGKLPGNYSPVRLVGHSVDYFSIFTMNLKDSSLNIIDFKVGTPISIDSLTSFASEGIPQSLFRDLPLIPFSSFNNLATLGNKKMILNTLNMNYIMASPK